MKAVKSPKPIQQNSTPSTSAARYKSDNSPLMKRAGELMTESLKQAHEALRREQAGK